MSATHVGTRSDSVAGGLLRTARPKQWLKNVLVFAAPGAAGVLDTWPQLGHALLAFVSFCLAAAGIYCWNDALDVDAATLARSRGAAINQACAALPYYLDTYPLIVERSWHKLAALGVPALAARQG